jgi:hypothetical protein
MISLLETKLINWFQDLLTLNLRRCRVGRARAAASAAAASGTSAAETGGWNVAALPPSLAAARHLRRVAALAAAAAAARDTAALLCDFGIESVGGRSFAGSGVGGSALLHRLANTAGLSALGTGLEEGGAGAAAALDAIHNAIAWPRGTCKPGAVTAAAKPELLSSQQRNRGANGGGKGGGTTWQILPTASFTVLPRVS